MYRRRAGGRRFRLLRHLGTVPETNGESLRCPLRARALVRDLPGVAMSDPKRARHLSRQLVGDSIRVVAGKDGEPELAFALSGTRLALAAGASPGPSELVGSGGPIWQLLATLPRRRQR